MESQTVCPLCKAQINGVKAGKKKKENTGKKPVARKWIPLYLLIVAVFFVLGYLGMTAWENGWLNTPNGDVEAQEIYRPSPYDDGKGIVDSLLPMDNARHTEEPAGARKANVIGYNYRLSQAFFQTEEDPEKEAKIKTILDDLNVSA